MRIRPCAAKHRMEEWVSLEALAEMPPPAMTWAVGHFVTSFALPFGHEDAAILWGAYVIMEGFASPLVVFSGLYAGIVASDVAVFGLGVGARRVPWLRRCGQDRRVAAIEERLTTNFVGLMVLCRIVPGLLFPAFVACGWSGVGLARFAASSVLLTAVQLPIFLGLSLALGTAAVEIAGAWAWLALAVPILGFALGRQSLKHLGAGLLEEGNERSRRPRVAVRDGSPPVTAAAVGVGVAEKVPATLFYAPLVLNWLRLAAQHGSLTLPTAVNPEIPIGGMWGESKSHCLNQISGEHVLFVATHVLVVRGESSILTLGKALNRLAESGIGFPLVAKPDIGWHGYGVRVLSDAEDLSAYLQASDVGTPIILQELVSSDAEAAILYVRHPHEATGRIASLTLRHCPCVVGDGCSSVRQLIRSSARGRWKAKLHGGRHRLHHGLSGSELKHVPASGEVVRLAFIASDRVGGSCQDLSSQVTDELERRIDAIARSMPEFHYGRFDLRFRSLQELRRGLAFKIFEVNGVGSEAIEVWDPARSLLDAYRTLLSQQALLFELGARNRERGFAPTPLTSFLGALRQQTKLISSYPPSE
jgi:membrane protein DedA with SNARE-associated domain